MEKERGRGNSKEGKKGRGKRISRVRDRGEEKMDRGENARRE
jgi:hypothetical protein